MTAEDIADYLLENGVTVQGWISVKDRLPDKFGEYIVTVEAIGGELYTDHADYDPFAKNWITGLYRLPVEEVTHWMPLPEPPKGE